MARQFLPVWFTTTMGTGIVVMVLLALPFDFAGRHAIAKTLWLIDAGVFCALAVLSIAKLALHFDTVRAMLDHPAQSMLLGAIPMGLAPIINGWSVFISGHDILLSALWWFDAALAMCVALLVPYRMFTRQTHATEHITAIWLLPIVAPEVAAASAGFLAPQVSQSVAQLMIATGYALWGISVPLAFMILTLLFLRLALHKLPHKDMAASMWLTLGPIGTASLGMLSLGHAALNAYAGTALADVAAIAQNAGLLVGIVLWGAGVWWLAIAMATLLHYRRAGMTFNMGWWGFTFPLGVYTLATFALYRATQFFPFAVIGTTLALLLFGFWCLVFAKTLGQLTLTARTIKRRALSLSQ